MSYCVNCGVEIEKGHSACPLCDTKVINPNEPENRDVKPPYPLNFTVPKSLSKKYIVFVVSLSFLIPNMIMLISDIVFFQSGISYYIAGAFAVLWIWFLFPFLWEKPIPVILLAFDALSLMVFTYYIKVTANNTAWFEKIAMPVIIALWAMCNVYLFWQKKKRRKESKAIFALTCVVIFTAVLEVCISLYLFGRLSFAITLIVATCCIALMAFFIALLKSRRLRAWASRKFFM